MICPDLPFPIRAGGQMRMASICEALAECCTLQIACISPDIPEVTREWAKVLGGTVEHFQDPDPDHASSWYRRVQAIITRNNLRYNPKEKLFFNDVLDRMMPEMVWLETPYLLRYALDWMDAKPIIVDYWGTSEGAKRLFKNAHGFKKIKEGLKWWAASGSEQYYSKILHDIVCVSKLDALHFQAIATRSRIWPIPIGIIKKSNGPAEVEEQEDPFTMILTGDLSYPPNVDAALFFADHIFPGIKHELPSAMFRIVGSNPSKSILALEKQPGVHVTGFVPDLSSEILRATIYVLPMRLGSGIRSKLFDVFPLGKAIVTTTIGAEGLELYHDRNCLIADKEHDFAQSCIQLLKNEKKRKELGNEAKRLATEVYSQENINHLIKEVVENVLRK